MIFTYFICKDRVTICFAVIEKTYTTYVKFRFPKHIVDDQ